MPSLRGWRGLLSISAFFMAERGPNYDALTRFLALCKVRYLPEPYSSSDYGEASYFESKICDNERMRRRPLNLTEAAFYHPMTKELGVLG